MTNNTSTDKATPLPWRVESYSFGIDIVDSGGVILFEIEGNTESNKALAALIVRAVNLLEAHETVVESAENLSAINPHNDRLGRYEEAAEKLDTALANLAKLKKEME